MKGVSLFCSDDKKQLSITVEPLLFEGVFSIETLTAFITETETEADSETQLSDFTLCEDSVLSLSDEITLAVSENNNNVLEKLIGEKKQPSIFIAISDDNMSATMTIIKRSDSDIPDIKDLVDDAKQQGINKGFSKKRVIKLLQQVINAEVGEELTVTIAKGLPARSGKDSFIKPLVPNALDRILAPQKIDGNKVDMRDLGDILCVKMNAPVAQIIAPSNGRSGMSVKGEMIPSSPGEWKKITMGSNTATSPNNENIIIAAVAGQPKFENGVMFIDDTFTAPKGVNVGTGNIKYDGAVIVNGDVTENMEIVAKGDITINGFVESAFIRSGGDIIITKGASGKMHDEDCRLIASGSIYIQHAQGLDIIAGKDVNVAKQLAYSRVNAKGRVTVGAIDDPTGSLFASTINCCSSLKAGSIGAISGSTLTIDFSEGYNLLCNKYDALIGFIRQLTMTNATHEMKLSRVNVKQVPAHIQKQLLALNDELEAERALLGWLRKALEELQNRKREYEINALVIANKELFPGVIVKLNKKIWRSNKEYQQCCVALDEGNWQYRPLI
ncbi:MAG: hypothetical protein ACJAVV_001014 [Alphaproteobacteria bacterium]|jgi:uncharacterized protein (DUF342 family)